MWYDTYMCDVVDNVESYVEWVLTEFTPDRIIDDIIDGIYPAVEIYDVKFRASHILKELDKTAYTIFKANEIDRMIEDCKAELKRMPITSGLTLNDFLWDVLPDFYYKLEEIEWRE